MHIGFLVLFHALSCSEVLAQDSKLSSTPTVSPIPDPALLEMLGEMENLEQMGIDVDHLIEKKLNLDTDDEQKELKKQ